MTVYLQDPDFTLYNGDALEVLRTLPDESVHMCVTSPPFYGLRDYGTGTWEGGDAECDHASGRKTRTITEATTAKNEAGNAYRNSSRFLEAGDPTLNVCGKCGATRTDRQIGLEETPEQWVQKLVEVFREVRRVLRRDGTLWLEVGDSYGANQSSGSIPKAGATKTGVVDAPNAWGGKTNSGGPHPYKPKDLIGAPWLLAFALRADGWYLRSDIIFSRPNPMPESVTDRPTKSHSYVFLLSKSARYFFDQEAVREQASENTHARYAVARETPKGREGHGGWDETTNGHVTARNVRSVWNIATQPYPEAHFATYPEELVRRCILAGTSERGCCPECGGAWVRETSVEQIRLSGSKGVAPTSKPGANNWEGVTARTEKQVQTLGWHPSCECGDRHAEPNYATIQRTPIPCTVLDPFSGSGTTALVARKHGRKCIGIELSADYCELSARRLQQLSLLSEAGA